MPATTDTGFTRPTLQELITAINTDLRGRIDALTGQPAAVLYALRMFAPVLAAVLAAMAWGVYLYLDYVARQIFPDTAASGNLDRHADIWGLLRNPATYAELYIAFDGEIGATIAEGSQVRRADGALFVTIEPFEITQGGGKEEVKARAIKAGADGNTDEGQAMSLVEAADGVDSEGTASTAALIAVDEEEDASLRERILFRIRNPPMGGCATDYEAWAYAVSGVGEAWCYPVEDGPGTVVVRFALEGDEPLPDDGAAHDVPLADADAGGHWVKVLKTDLTAALGYAPVEGDFVGGACYFERTGAAEPRTSPGRGAKATIDSAGLKTDGSDWKITFIAATDLTTPPALTETVAVLGSWPALVQDALNEQAPVAALPKARVPPAYAYTLAITLAVEEGFDAALVESAIEAEIIEMEGRGRAPGETIFNSTIHGAIMQASGIRYCRLTDVDGNGATGDVEPTGFGLPMLDSIAWTEE